jgi:hypothetical protein
MKPPTFLLLLLALLLLALGSGPAAVAVEGIYGNSPLVRIALLLALLLALVLLVVSFVVTFVVLDLNAAASEKRAVQKLSAQTAELTARLEARPASVGTIFCNYVDVAALRQLASDRGVPLDPTLSETTKSTRDTSGFKATIKGIVEGATGRERQDSERDVRELPLNPDSLTIRVIAALDRENLLRKRLITASRGTVGKTELETALQKVIDPELVHTLSEKVMDELRRAATHSLAESIRRAFTDAGDAAAYVLVESSWHVSKEAVLTLQLAQLRSSEGEAVDLPEGITMSVALVSSSSNAGFTDRGVARLQGCPEGESVRAGVLGTAEAFVNGRLRITPIVVFDRAGDADRRGRPASPAPVIYLR